VRLTKKSRESRPALPAGLTLSSFFTPVVIPLTPSSNSEDFGTTYLNYESFSPSMSDGEDVYWNSFLPAFFDRMSLVMRKNMTDIVSDHGLTSAHAVYLIALHIKDGQTSLPLP
jgi:hypothetical protein